MLTNWLAFTTFLAACAKQETEAITLATTCRVKGHPAEEQNFNCGHGQEEGVVQFWHTPFGEILSTDFHTKLDPVFMEHDGSLTVPRTTNLHSGLYYCLLQHSRGTTLWSYQLHVQNHSSLDAFRSRSSFRSGGRRQDVVSHELFVGAVVASVLLTFVMGFSAGALSRTLVLRCVSMLTTRLRSLQKPTNRLDSEVAMTTLPTTHDNQMMRTTHPPAKPQRSFRSKRQEEEQSPAYLEGCDITKEERRVEERRVEEKTMEGERGMEKKREFYQSVDGVDGGRKNHEEMNENKGEGGDSPNSDNTGGGEAYSGRRRRVIRLYQYDDDGQRYSHLPVPSPNEPNPAPRLKHRSVSLTRLNAIMTAYVAPLETRKEGESSGLHVEM